MNAPLRAAIPTRTAAQFQSMRPQQGIQDPSERTVPATGNSVVDTFGDLAEVHLSPFTDAPDLSEQPLGAITSYASGVVSLLELPTELIEHGLAIVTGPLGKLVTRRAATMGTIHVGKFHGHMHPPSFNPPAIPTPIKFPSVGGVTTGCLSVLIEGKPAARAGDVGLAPTCFGFFPGFLIASGSSKVYFGGARAACEGDVTIVCNPVIPPMLSKLGLAAGAAMGAVGAGATLEGGDAAAAELQVKQAALDTAAQLIAATIGKDPGVLPACGVLAMNCASTVEIGGLPLPPLNVARQLLGAAAGKADVPPRNRRHHDNEGGDGPRRNHQGHCLC